jgi:hypothetical protein
MALTKLQLQPGINREVTRYTNGGGWIDGDKIRFRQGFPEKIGGWQQLSNQRFSGVCRAITEWATLGGANLLGVGTHLKYYIARGGQYFDITPLRLTTAPGVVTFTATTGSTLLRVNHTSHGASVGDFVTFSGAVSLGGDVTDLVLNAEYQVVEVLNLNEYRVTIPVAATSGDTGTGGAAVVAEYQVAVGAATQQALSGWGAGAWGFGTWGVGVTGAEALRLWNHSNYGQDLIYGPRGGGLYYWDAATGVGTRGVQIVGNDTPVQHLALLVSDVSRFVIAFGCNELGEVSLDPMLVRWSDQEQYNNWTPAITNQAGGLRLSVGSSIVTARQNRQEVLIWTDSALYSMQYQGPPYVWGVQLLGDGLSIAGPNAVAVSNGAAYWMGRDAFYQYNGRVQPLPCAVHRFVFQNLNTEQLDQITCGRNEQFHEVWWHYASVGSLTNDRYVVYNYLDNIWYYGTMHRTAWLDSALLGQPVAAANDRLIVHEIGADDAAGNNPQPIAAHITSGEVAIGDGDRFSFIRRVLPDITFTGSTATNPSAVFEMQPLRNSGAGLTDPASVGGLASGPTVRTAVAPVEQYTGQLNIRVRGRQIRMRISSTEAGVKWQLGSPRVDLLPDGYNG